MKLEDRSDRKLELLVDRWVKNSQKWWPEERSAFSSWNGGAVSLIDAMRFQ